MLDQTVKSARALNKAMPDAELARLVDDLAELRPTLPGLAPQPVAVDRRGSGGQPQPDAIQPGTAPMASPSDVTMTPASARGVRTSHERAYKVLHGG
jgi:hypothetical protein